MYHIVIHHPHGFETTSGMIDGCQTFIFGWDPKYPI